jgi:hypothetical protein
VNTARAAEDHPPAPGPERSGRDELDPHDVEDGDADATSPRRSAGLLVRAGPRVRPARPLPSLWPRQRDPLSCGPLAPGRLGTAANSAAAGKREVIAQRVPPGPVRLKPTHLGLFTPSDPRTLTPAWPDARALVDLLSLRIYDHLHCLIAACSRPWPHFRTATLLGVGWSGSYATNDQDPRRAAETSVWTRPTSRPSGSGWAAHDSRQCHSGPEGRRFPVTRVAPSRKANDSRRRMTEAQSPLACHRCQPQADPPTGQPARNASLLLEVPIAVPPTGTARISR